MASTVSPSPFQVAVGSYTGTGSAIAVADIGFKPHFLLILNETDGDVMFMVIRGLADGKAYMLKDSGSGTTDMSVISSAAITLDTEGFDVSTDSDINETDKVYRYIAL